jgi:hypothetical protein
VVAGILLVAVALASSGGTNQKQPPLPPVIFTAAPVYESLAALDGGERFPQGAQLLLLTDGQMRPLVPGFAASADATISFDAKTVLFAGRKNPGDPWQIWQVAVDGGTPHLVRSADTDLIRPLSMPDGRLVYARRLAAGFGLETAGLDGSSPLRLTWLPGNFVPDDVLRDGRVLFESKFPLGAGSVPEMFLVYADGSGVESVRCDHGVAREHGRQLLNGDIVFTHGNTLARFTSPLAAESAIAAPAGDYAGDIVVLPDGRWLIAQRKPRAKHYALLAWKPGSAATTAVAQNPDRDLVEPVIVMQHAIPNRHPSGLHDWAFGNLLVLDARQSRTGALDGTPAAVRAETMAADGKVMSLGTAPVEQDGSFFVQATGDRPLRFVLLDAAGNTLREEHGWFWVRRGEQRICVGCHTGPERAPDNRVPQVLQRTQIPADLTGTQTTARAVPGSAGGHSQ